MNSISERDLESYKEKIRGLSNRALYDQAFSLAKKYLKKYPNEIVFKYDVAVFSAEEEVGFSESEIRRRRKSAARQLKPLLKQLRCVVPRFRNSIRNEYYWFSEQPLKQYHLGLELVRKGFKTAYYPQGVGAERLARQYALAGRKKLCTRWAKKSEKAWLKFFKVSPRWHNSYFFYAGALGYQGKIKEMDEALDRARMIAGKPKNWKTTRELRLEILKAWSKISEN